MVASLDRKCLGHKCVRESGTWLRGIFDKETRRKPLAVAAPPRIPDWRRAYHCDPMQATNCSSAAGATPNQCDAPSLWLSQRIDIPVKKSSTSCCRIRLQP